MVEWDFMGCTQPGNDSHNSWENHHIFSGKTQLFRLGHFPVRYVNLTEGISEREILWYTVASLVFLSVFCLLHDWMLPDQ